MDELADGIDASGMSGITMSIHLGDGKSCRAGLWSHHPSRIILQEENMIELLPNAEHCGVPNTDSFHLKCTGG